MASTRSLIILLLATLLTVLAVFAHPLIPEKQLSLLPEADLPVIFDPYGDSGEGGPSHSEWVGAEEDRRWRCRVEEAGDYTYCGLNLLLAEEGYDGVDLTGYHSAELALETPGHDKDVQFFMRHYDHGYSNPDDGNSPQFNKFDLLGEELDEELRIGFGEITLADWWSAERSLPRELRRPAFDNVVAIGIGYAQDLEPGEYDIVLKRVRIIGDWVSAEAWYRGILLLWLAGVSLWALRRMLVLSRLAHHHRRKLDHMATRHETLQRKTDRYKHLSARDPLTGAYNRFGFEQRLSDMVHREAFHPMSLIMMDVDHFKRFNDTHGHDAGDRVLQQLVSTVAAQTRRDDLVCRWGGEEFLLLCPATTENDALRMAEKLRRTVAETRLDSLPEVRLTASFGVCELAPGESYADAFARADRALYRAKSQGRDSVIRAAAAVVDDAVEPQTGPGDP